MKWGCDSHPVMKKTWKTSLRILRRSKKKKMKINRVKAIKMVASVVLGPTRMSRKYPR